MDPNKLGAELKRCGFSLSRDQIRGLQIYLELLLKWNKVINLVGPSDWKLILHDLILDSFHLSTFLSRTITDSKGLKTLDLGAGAGLPGIPLRLVWKAGSYYLVESRTKRAVFMNQALAAMDIENTHVINGRVQQLDTNILPAGLIISRAFMPGPKLLPLAKELLAIKGMLIILSKDKSEAENPAGFTLIDEMHYRVNNKDRYFLALESNI